MKRKVSYSGERTPKKSIRVGQRVGSNIICGKCGKNMLAQIKADGKRGKPFCKCESRKG